MAVCPHCLDASANVLAAEIERLQELLRGVGANRYWEQRWRDEQADNAPLRRDLEIWRRNGGDTLLQAENARLRAALKLIADGTGKSDNELSDRELARRALEQKADTE